MQVASTAELENLSSQHAESKIAAMDEEELVAKANSLVESIKEAEADKP